MIDEFEFEVRRERDNQLARFGEQSHSPFKYYAILAEECGEVAKGIVDAYDFKSRKYSQAGLEHTMIELVQTAAVAKAMYENIKKNYIKDCEHLNQNKTFEGKTECLDCKKEIS